VHWKVEEEESEVLFRRIRALGLHDIIEHTAGSRARLSPCSCARPNECTHVRTYRHNNKLESRPTQLDYAFCSEALLTRVVACEVHDEEAAWALSDHCPIVLDLADTLPGLP
jgi:endonuclease/exonuclease/phosphatase family metal-dependent hydrolase